MFEIIPEPAVEENDEDDKWALNEEADVAEREENGTSTRMAINCVGVHRLRRCLSEKGTGTKTKINSVGVRGLRQSTLDQLSRDCIGTVRRLKLSMTTTSMSIYGTFTIPTRQTGKKLNDRKRKYTEKSTVTLATSKFK